MPLPASRSWPPRISGAVLKDLNRELDQVRLDIADLERWRERFFEAIQQGSVVDQSGTRIPLDETRGIDILGNMMEASILTPNSQLYGDLHNMGHVFVSFKKKLLRFYKITIELFIRSLTLTILVSRQLIKVPEMHFLLFIKFHQQIIVILNLSVSWVIPVGRIFRLLF